MLQATVCDGGKLDASAFGDDLFCSAEVDVGWRQIFDTLMKRVTNGARPRLWLNDGSCIRLRQLEDENAKLKKLLAEQMLDAAALRDVCTENLIRVDDVMESLKLAE